MCYPSLDSNSFIQNPYHIVIYLYLLTFYFFILNYRTPPYRLRLLFIILISYHPFNIFISSASLYLSHSLSWNSQGLLILSTPCIPYIYPLATPIQILIQSPFLTSFYIPFSLLLSCIFSHLALTLLFSYTFNPLQIFYSLITLLLYPFLSISLIVLTKSTLGSHLYYLYPLYLHYINNMHIPY